MEENQISDDDEEEEDLEPPEDFYEDEKEMKMEARGSKETEDKLEELKDEEKRLYNEEQKERD